MTSFNKDKRYDFSGGRKVQSSLPWCLFFESTRKNLKSNPVLVVILVLISKALHYYSFVQLSAIRAFISHVLVIWWWLSISVNVAVAVFVAFLLLLLAVDNAAAVSDLVLLSL